MTNLVVFLLVFASTGLVFVGANLFLGKLIRPNRPSPDKGDIYECGEKPVGTAYIQFDLRFYVVALLFVLFDVEIAFFFPWATVFGQATQAANASDPAAQTFGQFAFVEFLIFFGILLVGFAYCWKRGDLEWVRSQSNTTVTEQDKMDVTQAE
jgi:NADH-quinone oxidoreductase subunit A